MSARPEREPAFEPATSFTPFQAYAPFDSAWNFGSASSGIGSLPINLSPPAIPGFSGSAPGGTSTIGIRVYPGDQHNWATWRRNLDEPLVGETIYRIQAKASSSAATGLTSNIRLRFGTDFFAENGMGELSYPTGSASTPGQGTSLITMYHWSKCSTSTTPAPGGINQPALSFDLIAAYEPSVTPADYRLHSITIDSIPRGCLRSPRVLENRGALQLTDTDGQIPPGDPKPFAMEDYLFGNFADAGSSVTATASTSTPVDGALNLAFNSSFSGTQTGFAAFMPRSKVFSARNDRLYCLEAWVSTAETPNSATCRPPVLRLRMSDSWDGPHVSRQTAMAYFGLGPDQNFNGVPDNEAGIQVGGSARHYALFWKPDLNTESQPDTMANMVVDLIYNRQGVWAIYPKGVLSVERLVLTEYDIPR